MEPGGNFSVQLVMPRERLRQMNRSLDGKTGGVQDILGMRVCPALPCPALHSDKT
jgi:hypothetical protein